jgi:formylglycine-generating enzyme required for sulfatase activity
MGSDPVGDEDDSYLGQPRHRVYLPDYYIGRTPVTNAQFLLFVRTTGHHMPDHWEGGRPLPGTEKHPMVFISWEDARVYCEWLQVSGFRLKVWHDGQPETLRAEPQGKVLNLQPETLTVRLPTEAEWEKAARGTDGRAYPWGNVWEWTSSVRRPYPYDAEDGREDPASGDSVRRDDIIGHGDSIRRSGSMRRVVRGGSFLLDRRYARCAVRYGSAPEQRTWVYGFRVAVSGPYPLPAIRPHCQPGDKRVE